MSISIAASIGGGAGKPTGSLLGGVIAAVRLPKITGLVWRDLPVVNIPGLAIGDAFSHLEKLIAPQPIAVIKKQIHRLASYPKRGSHGRIATC